MGDYAPWFVYFNSSISSSFSRQLPVGTEYCERDGCICVLWLAFYARHFRLWWCLLVGSQAPTTIHETLSHRDEQEGTTVEPF